MARPLSVQKTGRHLFVTMPESSINSWDSWFIFNLRKINTSYYTDTTCTRKEAIIDGHGRYVCSKSVNVALQNSTDTLDNVHT
jgi:hypothetical protein